MAKVAVVTDSVSDLPSHIIDKYGITIVPINLAFGTEAYRDRVDITPDEFYEKLETSGVMPVTSTPSPAVIAAAYDSLAEQADGIVFISVSAQLSGTCQNARDGISLMKNPRRVEVVDSETAVMPQGFIAIAAAAAARDGADIEEVLAVIDRTKSRVGMLAAFDTLEYLKRGGRIGKAQAFLGSLLNVNPVIGLKDGVVEPVARARSRMKALDRLCEFPAEFEKAEEIYVEYAVDRGEAETLMKRLRTLYPGVPVSVTRASPVIGTHTGPSLIVVSVLGNKKTG